MTPFENPLFIDIETISCVPSYEDLSPRMQACWLKKASHSGGTKEEQEKMFRERGGIFSEFGRIVVIAMGYVARGSDGKISLRIKSLADHDEKALLHSFKKELAQFPPSVQLCGHNGKEFDFPYLARRMTVHGIRLPLSLDTAGKKPWEVNHIDTMELWKFGDRKQYTSLDLLATIFDIPSSKDEMAGNEVTDYYYEKKDLPSIARYCAKDVVVTAQVFRKLKMLPLIPVEDIHIKQPAANEQDVAAPKKKSSLPLLDR